MELNSFLDLNINLNEDRKISCLWYQKSTDTGIILNFRSCAPLHNRNVLQGTVHRICNATSDWQSFDVALKKNQEILLLLLGIYDCLSRGRSDP